MKRFLVIAISLLSYFSTATSQNLLGYVAADDMQHWVDSMMEKLTPDERLGQLIMPLYYMPEYTSANRATIEKEMKAYHLGGILFSKGTRKSQTQFVDYSQQLSQKQLGLPLLIAADAEWGTAMRLKDGLRFPMNKDLAMIDPQIRDSMLYQYGLAMAEECHALGIHVSFAPVLDINSNPKNPIIGARSFGADQKVVTSCGLSYASGLEDGGVMAVAKHFPGHGDTDVDSHKQLPLLSHSAERMRTFEMQPFQDFSRAGFGGIMTAHLEVPSLEPTKGMPATASKNILTDELRTRMGFKGLVFTDGLAMEGARNYPDICVKALNAGVDILLQPTPIDVCWNQLKDAIKKKKLKQTTIDEKCRRVLMWKYALIVGPERQKLLYPSVKPADKPKAISERLYALVKAGNAANATLLAEKDYLDPTEANTKANTEIVAAKAITSSHPTIPAGPSPYDSVDRLATNAIKQGAMPGCQILAIHKGEIIYNKSFGTLAPVDGNDNQLDWLAGVQVNNSTLYDLASVSKAAATVPAVILAMKEYHLKLTDRITKWLPELKKTTYAKVTLQDLLYHESGLRDFYPFYKDFPEITPEVREKEMIKTIAGLKPKRKQGRYLYSCLNFVLLRYIVERVSKQQLDDYLQQRLAPFYGNELCFRPLDKEIDLSQIAPTEVDNTVRNRLIHGTVHDEIGEWAQGVEGNSGLFGSASALARIIMLMKNEGSADGKQYLDQALCHQFITQRSPRSRRNLGFDRQVASGDKLGTMAQEASAKTWGHTGFTGTCFWVDPEADLVYIFLSNRVCPTRNNKAWSDSSVRSQIHSEFYKLIKK